MQSLAWTLTTETYATAESVTPPSMLPEPKLPEELPASLRCAYPSKRSDNPRTLKKSGGLHRFCAFHRDRANRNQWRVDHRRRMLKKCGVVANDTTAPSNGTMSCRGQSPRCLVDWDETAADAEAAALARREARHAQDFSVSVDAYEVCSSREAELNAQDVAILSELLMVDNTSTSPLAFNTNTTGAWPALPTADPALYWWPVVDAPVRLQRCCWLLIPMCERVVTQPASFFPLPHTCEWNTCLIERKGSSMAMALPFKLA